MHTTYIIQIPGGKNVKTIFFKTKRSGHFYIPNNFTCFNIKLYPLIELSVSENIIFFIAFIIIIFGIALFSIGADMSMTPMGKYDKFCRINYLYCKSRIRRNSYSIRKHSWSYRWNIFRGTRNCFFYAS
ncbi:MAG: DUF1538 family protein [Clostridia bacterium]|nr:DUF1538 family protein [Clostridia bacterium]